MNDDRQQPGDTLDEEGAIEFAEYMRWMYRVEKDLDFSDPEVFWRSMTRILSLISDTPAVDWRELRDDTEATLRRAFTRSGERDRDGAVIAEEGAGWWSTTAMTHMQNLAPGLPGTPASRPDGHYPKAVPAPKMDTPGLWTGACSCGWRSTGLASTQASALKKMAYPHADTRNAALALMRVSLHVVNRYELYDDAVRTFTDELMPLIPAETASHDGGWTHELHDRFTGVGHEKGDSWYDITVTDCSLPEMIAKTWLG